MKRWYVVQVYTGYEDVVREELKKRIVADKLTDLFGDILVPTGEAAQFWTGEEVKKEKIFPGYVLIQMEMSREAYRLVMSTTRVYKFLGGENPIPLMEAEVERIHSQVSGKLSVTPKKLPFAVGSEISISSGPFAGFVGTIDKIDEEHEKLTVGVSIFGRLTPVELGFDQVK
ncbi:TPA: transcription termination/antitermination factor NusG [Candidatus Dependentiae bacterium]|nr:MAG: Transcription antitermination protein nusG [candidate division TM6 bacterium GW2011_GWE2_31_21]KKP54043.1 MAG: Transcription antitermination protein nusG [candidate division TM6 bacterium GW2011_GWF2_33_332]HBS48374.1 transcription termination/antitermination factor NusG [Candidatus Dependentiae bacterium]HBZ72952.1 transcription termination/antitermination factor NusG [Candidatus Dependentiae bacterium]